MSVVTVAELKTYLGLTTSADDALLSQVLSDAEAQAEQDTGRTFATASNVTRVYSTNDEASFVIHDRPFSDASRVVQRQGVALTEGTDVWFLPDRRDPNVTTVIQLRHFDRSRGDWYKAYPGWFDKNLDRLPASSPNDLEIVGVIGHPFPSPDVEGSIRLLAAWMYWRAKSGASGVVTTPTGEEIDLAVLPPGYARFVERWSVRTGVTAI